MSDLDVGRAREYVAGLDLKGIPRRPKAMGLTSEGAAGAVFDKAKDQAQVVGSGLLSFAKGVDDSMREAISDSALLAQLVADKQAPLGKDPIAWFDKYAEVLKNVGWVLQDFGLQEYETKGQEVDVNKEIMGVLTAALAPGGAAALVIIQATMDALQAMDPSSPWLTLFSHEAEKGTIARFQVGIAEPDGAGGAFVTLLVSLIDAKKQITQVLFFKYRSAEATLKTNVQKVSLNAAALKDLGPVIRTKVRAYAADYLSSIKDI